MHTAIVQMGLRIYIHIYPSPSVTDCCLTSWLLLQLCFYITQP